MTVRFNALLFALFIVTWRSAMADESPRITPTVKIIEKVQPAVVPLFTRASDNSGGTGSGVVIYPTGFILTADHVTQDFEGVALFGLQRVPYQVVGRLPERDLAILKVSIPNEYIFAPLGRSHDLKAGEPIIVGGNPAGRGVVFSLGIINAPSIDPSWPSILTKSYWRTDLDEAKYRQLKSTGGRPDFIQYDASTNRGNSGGPLINYEGQVIGIVSHKSFVEEGINWAIPADRIRLLFPYLVQPEEYGDFESGLVMDLLSHQATVLKVAEGQAAWKAGLRDGDVIVKADGREVGTACDWLLMLWGHKPGDKIELTYQRDDKTHETTLTLDATNQTIPAVSIDGKTEGIHYQYYKGRFAALPDFGPLKPVKTGTTQEISIKQIVAANEESFAIRFSGFMKFPKPGLYRVHLESDDCSRLFLGDRLIIDNDLPHPLQKLSRWIRVGSDPVPFHIEYAELSGDKAISFKVSKSFDEHDDAKVQFYSDADDD